MDMPKVKTDEFNRDELNTLATEEGLAQAETYSKKADVVEAINRVRDGEAPADIDAEYGNAPSKSNLYRVVVNRDLSGTSALHRRRAGIAVPVGRDGIVVELTEDQKKAIEADEYLTVEPYTS